jgi:hypothetical protein
MTPETPFTNWIDWRPVKKTATLIIDAMIRGLTRPGSQ